MKKILNYLTVVTTALLVAMAWSTAQAEVVISTGVKGLTYDGKYGVSFVRILGEYEVPSKRVRSRGAVENMNRLCKGEADFAPTQGDAYSVWVKKNPNCANDVYPIGKLPKECVFAASNGKVKDEDDIKSGVTVASGKPYAGSGESWNFLKLLEPDYAEATTTRKGELEAIGGLNAGQIDLFVWVNSMDNAEANRFAKMVNKSENLNWVELDDHSLNEKLPDGSQVYTFETVVVDSSGIFNTEVEAPCTDTLVLTRRGADPKAVDILTEALIMDTPRIIAGE